MSDEQLKFDIENGIISAVYELDDGVWELEDISENKTYTIEGSDILEAETYTTHIEVKTYQDSDGDGIYTRVSEQYILNNGSSIDNSTSDDNYITINGQLYEQEDEIYNFDLSIDASYQIGDDTYQVLDGVVYELEDDGYYTNSGYSYIQDGETYQVQTYYESLEESELEDTTDDLYVTIDSIQFEVESEDEALTEDSSLIRLYQAVFNRLPDESGYEFWSKSLDSYDDFDDVIEKFSQSDEYQSIYGDLNNEEFLTQLYLNVLGREGDENGFAWWLNVLDSGATTQLQTVYFFSNSEEFISDMAEVVTEFIAVTGQHSITESELILN
jgi:hypothetical protein